MNKAREQCVEKSQYGRPTTAILRKACDVRNILLGWRPQTDMKHPLTGK